MARVIAVEHLTLDGVYQAPARPDEAPRGDFRYGGWSAPGNNPAMQAAIGARMAGGGSRRMGRVTYEDLRGAWEKPKQSNPFSDALNGVTKYVAARTLSEPLGWQHSHLLAGDVPAAVVRLKRETEEALIIFGSGQRVRALMQRNLVDELLLMIHPVVLGQGLRLFAEGAAHAPLELTESSTTPTGVIIASYRPKI